ncbi:MAG: Gfo/Idh/MocA family oxidoreductase [Candidatus Marinimicrobia bacterium]|nr:Gfo/Idh/MocA family oxidoreductase [Candidatus Neomarinimicrobiota bacterium]
MSHSYKWGILSTGKIANHFAEGLTLLDAADIHAVGSRAIGTAERFADKWSITNAYGSYDELYNDKEVDIIYIGTPHNLHYQNTMDALSAGKHVLCEKAFALNANQARNMVELARHQGLFLMDAMWNRFQPWYTKVQEIISSGVLGELIHFKADLSFKFDFDPQHRLFNPDLGGGSLLDLGVYPLTLASAFMGAPDVVHSTVHKCSTGVDDQVTMILSYPEGASSELASSSRYTSKINPALFGSEGSLEIHGMIRSGRLTLHLPGKDPEVIEVPYVGNAYQYEAQAVMDMLDQNKLEHPLMPLEETVANLQIMDLIRKNAEIKYPEEHEAVI